MSVLAFHGAVLVRDAGVVAGRRHAVMGAESLVTAGLVEAGVVIEIAERGGEAVKAVFARHAAQAPQGVLQSDRQRGVALAAQHRLGMLPGGVGQHEVIQPVIERLAGDADGQGAHVGEIR